MTDAPSTPELGDGDVQRSVVLGPVYQALMARYASNTTVVWQIPSLGLTAQAFLIGAASQISGRIATEFILAAAILGIGAVTILVSQRIELLCLVDRQMIDRFEAELLTGRNEHLRLLHGVDIWERERRLGLPTGRGWSSRVGRSWLLRRIRPRLFWAILQISISLTGAAVPILWIFQK